MTTIHFPLLIKKLDFPDFSGGRLRKSADQLPRNMVTIQVQMMSRVPRPSGLLNQP